ncbi:MAG: hydrogenase iron-sulfur subunit [Halopenitus sp.]
MNVGAFVCSCGGSSDIDLETVRDGVRNVDVVGSSEQLCLEGRDAMAHVVDEHDLEQLIVTAAERTCKDRIHELADGLGLHPEATEFIDHRELAARVHDSNEATDKVARRINATHAGLRAEAVSKTVTRDAGDRVLVVGDPDAASTLADDADVTLVADGRDLSGAEDLESVTIERGRVREVDGQFGDFEVNVEARVTEDCISCMDCVREGPDGMVTARPVDIDPEAPRGEWVNCCPTDAIDLDGVERTLSADQVVAPSMTPETVGGRVGFYTRFDAGTAAAVEHLLGGVEKPQHLDLEMDVCAAGSSSQEGCTACTDACPHGAVARPAVDEVEFDPVACQNCGACTSSCPTGAVTLREPSNERIAREVEALLDEKNDEGWWPFSRDPGGIETPVIGFVCSERAADRLREYGRRAGQGEDVAYPPVLPVRVNCTDTVGEAHVMHALAAGADGVAIVGCGADCLHSGPDPKAALVERLNQATHDLGLGERVAFFAPGTDHEPFVDDLQSFADRLAASPVPTGEHVATGVVDDERPNPEFNSHEWTLESVRTILRHVDAERDLVRGLKDFGRLEVSDACNLTPTCSNLCPTDAIRRTSEGNLQFNHERCVNCGLCEEGCPETAITMQDGLDLSLLPERRDGDEPEWQTVHEGEMLECVRCGKPFTSVGSAEKIQEEVGDMVEGIAPGSDHDIFEYCADCRSRLLFEEGEMR